MTSVMTREVVSTVGRRKEQVARRPSAPVKCTSVTSIEARITGAPSNSTVPTASTSTRPGTLATIKEEPTCSVLTTHADIVLSPNEKDASVILTDGPIRDLIAELDLTVESASEPITTKRFEGGNLPNTIVRTEHIKSNPANCEAVPRLRSDISVQAYVGNECDADGFKIQRGDIDQNTTNRQEQAKSTKILAVQQETKPDLGTRNQGVHKHAVEAVAKNNPPAQKMQEVHTLCVVSKIKPKHAVEAVIKNDPPAQGVQEVHVLHSGSTLSGSATKGPAKTGSSNNHSTCKPSAKGSIQEHQTVKDKNPNGGVRVKPGDEPDREVAPKHQDTSNEDIVEGVSREPRLPFEQRIIRRL